jgi:hypothetical protein
MLVFAIVDYGRMLLYAVIAGVEAGSESLVDRATTYDFLSVFNTCFEFNVYHTQVICFSEEPEMAYADFGSVAGGRLRPEVTSPFTT